MGAWLIKNVAGTPVDLTDHGFTVLSVVGLGMPPMQPHTSRYGYGDGSFYQRSTADERPFTLVGILSGTSITDLHDKRLALINLVKRDRQVDDEPFTLQYTGNTGVTLEIDCVYQSGLEYNHRSEHLFTERLSITFLAVDPFWRNSVQASSTPSTFQSVSNANWILFRNEGDWQAMDTVGMNGVVYAIEYADDGTYYIGGEFGQAGDGVPEVALGAARYDPTTDEFSRLGTGFGSGEYARALALVADGGFYVGGSFADAGGVANTPNIAYYDPDTDNFTALGTGVNDEVRAIEIGTDGKVYVGGDFTTAGGVSVNHCAIWNPATSTWSAIPDTASFALDPSYVVHALAFDHARQKLYIGGAMPEHLYVYDIATSSTTTAHFSLTATDNPNGNIYALELAPNGDLFLGGAFTATDLGTELNHIAKWNQYAYEALGAGMNATVRSLSVTPNGTLWAGGEFATAGGHQALRLASWNGSSWNRAPVTLPNSPIVYAISTPDEYTMMLGYDNFGTATTNTLVTITPTATTKTYPTITFANSAGSIGTQVHEWANLTTGEIISFRDLHVLGGETITADLRPGHKTLTSSWRGNLSHHILPGSKFASFGLLPASNEISIYHSNGDGVLTVAFYPAFWSVDA